MPTNDGKIQICLCLSGQMRNFERNFDWLKTCDERLNVSVVVATWSQRGGKLWGAMGLNRMREVLPDGIAEVLPASWMADDVFEHLPGIRQAAIDRALHERISLQAIQAVLPEATIHIEEPLKFTWFERSKFAKWGTMAKDPFSLAMLYKIWQADLLRKNLEAEQGHRFDVVIRARPDLPFEVPTYSFLKHVSPDEIYVDRCLHDRRDAGDSFALGDSLVMDRYADFFMTSYRKSMRGDWHYIHHELYEYLVTSGISLRQYPTLGYSPDRLIKTIDVLEAIRRRSSSVDLPTAGLELNTDTEYRLLCGSIALVDKLNTGQINCGSPEVAEHVGELLSNFNSDRDGGFFGVLASKFDRDNDPSTALICFALSIRTEADGELSPALVDRYRQDIFPILKTVTRKGLEICDPIKLLMECLHSASEGRVRPLIQSYFGKANFDRVSAKYERIHLSLFEKPWLVVWFLDHYQSNREYERAELVVKKGLEILPGDGHLQARLAMLYAIQNRFDEAVVQAQLAEHTQEGWVQFLTGKALLQIGKPDDAERTLTRAITLYPADPDYYMELSAALRLQGKNEEAIKFAYEAASRSPETMGHRHNFLGHILKENGRILESEAAFREALRRSPDWDDLRNQLTSILSEQRRFCEAASIEIDRAELGFDSTGPSQKLINWLRMATGDDGKLIIERARKIWPKDDEIARLAQHH